MAKKKKGKKRKKQKRKESFSPEGFVWQEDDGTLHSIMEGSPPTPEKLEEMSKAYQAKIRQSPLWNVMVNEYGLEKAEQLLKQFRAELR